jgi:chromosome segregation ATPase
MIMRRQRWAEVAFAASLLCSQAPLRAQVQRSGGGEAQKFMQQYQQVSAEKTALQAQLAQMKKDLDAATTELAAVKKERDVAKAHAGVPAAAIGELVSRFRETATNLQQVEADRGKLREDLAKRNNAYDKCAENNLQLYEINGELLDRYEHVGLFTRVSAAEPFTKITRTRIENLVEETRGRAQELRVKKTTP